MPRRLIISLAVISVAAFSGAGAQQADAPPALVRTPQGMRLLVDGAPYLMLGAQAHNSSGSSQAALDSFWKGVEALGANTAEVPVYWELLEPEPGRFDFTLVDAIVRGARERRLRAVLLWFASWKNGEMHYAPAWVTRDRRTYRRVIGEGGDEREILSPLSTAARDADARAFTALMQHLRDTDTAHTVVMVQVENEPGLLGADRDHSPEATKLFEGPVPGALTSYLQAHRATLGEGLATTPVAAGRQSGTWREMFGERAAEAFTAWHLAQYIDGVASAGKAAYPLPMYVNVWLINPGDERTGRWPSGGATWHVIDVWKAAAPHIDLLAPDVYQPHVLREIGRYVRPDNALFVPEIGLQPYFAAFPFAILAQPSALGVSPFGVEAPAAQDADAGQKAFARTFRLLRPLLPLIARLQGTGHVHAITQDLDWGQVVRIGERLALVVDFTQPFKVEGPNGAALVLQTAPDELVMTGVQAQVAVRDIEAPLADPHRWATREPILWIEEGTFDGDRWLAGRRLNGDERHVRFDANGTTLKVKLSL